MQAWRRLLLPFSFFYAIIVYVRNFLFDIGSLKSVSFSIPILAIGNLTAGGSGKTPHVEYLIKLLKNDFCIATLSRGYGRETKGYILASRPVNTHIIGDEPMQYFTKYKDIYVCVSEDRIEGIKNLIKLNTTPQVVLMDDAYQHRKVKPGLNILLLEYENIFRADYFLPAGNLREPLSAMKRADIIIISKSPNILVPIERKRIIEHLSLRKDQQIFFSFLKYGEFNKVFGHQNEMQMGAGYYLEKRFTILLVTGIANPSGIIEYLKRHTDKLEMIIFPDHHEFSKKDITKIQQTFDNIANSSKIIVTTEKDAMRLKNPDIDSEIQKLPFFFLPIEVQMHQDGDKFNQLITDYVRKNQPHNKIHTRKNN
jgi:tetraacyldisaccharide 4'-kinase